MAKKRIEKVPSMKVLLKSINIDKKPTYLPTDEILRHFEGLHGISLPTSYKKFIQFFGAGMLSGYCQFFSPGCGFTSFWDMYVRNLNHKRFVIESETTNTRSKDLIVFGSIWSGEDYGWVPSEISNEKPREYCIYAVSRFMDTTTKLANSFPEFIWNFCLGAGLNEYLQLQDPISQPRNSYVVRG